MHIVFAFYLLIILPQILNVFPSPCDSSYFPPPPAGQTGNIILSNIYKRVCFERRPKEKLSSAQGESSSFSTTKSLPFI